MNPTYKKFWRTLRTFLTRILLSLSEAMDSLNVPERFGNLHDLNDLVDLVRSI